MEKFLRNLPKIELHAHLNGSLSDETLKKLIVKSKDSGKCPSELDRFTIKDSNRTIEECFQIFKIIHHLTEDIEVVGEITTNVIREFYEENVSYLELRTTPKSLPDVYTKRQYIEKVLNAIQTSESQLEITVRLLLSIDRGRGVEDARDTVHLCRELLNHESYRKYICGLDISGNPAIGSLSDFVPVLEEARLLKLKLTVHLMEVSSQTGFEEALALLKLGLVDRIGHGTFIHPLSGGKEELYQLVKKSKIPFEMCLSSNIKSQTVPTLEEHHIKLWRDEGHPFTICTDDKGLFATSLTEELLIFHKAVGAKEEEFTRMMSDALEFSFLRAEEKEKIKSKIDSFCKSIAINS